MKKRKEDGRAFFVLHYKNNKIFFMKKPRITLFMLMSVDGKISTGDTEVMDVDKDFPNISGLKEGLSQYYEIEQQTDLFSLNTGKVLAKIGVNEKNDELEKSPVSFVVIDSNPHLTDKGVVYLAKKTTKLIIVTTNKLHPAFLLKDTHQNIHIIFYEKEIIFEDLFAKLRDEYGVENLTVQSGGTLNSVLVRDGFIDRLLLVVAPALIGGKNTATLIDGESLHNPNELCKIKTLELVEAKPLKNSYLLLEYKVKN